MSDIANSRTYAQGEKGGKGGGGGGRIAREAPNTLQTRHIARVLYIIGEGVNGGLVDGLKSVYIDDTPIKSADGTANFQGITVHERLGAPDQLPIPGFDAIEQEKPVGLEVTRRRPVVRRVDDANVDSVRIKILFPALLKQNTKNGDINPTSVAFTIETRPVASSGQQASWTVVHNVNINDKTNSPQQLAWRFLAPDRSDAIGGDWEWRVVRKTADSEKSSLQNKIRVSSVTWITDGKLTYPHSHIIGVIASAEQFGERIPEPSFDIRGISNIMVPSNYDPETRDYSTEIWDGVLKPEWTDNPAWIFYAVIINALWGLGRYIAPAQVSALKWDCYEIGKFCDQLVPDGYGGMEPRFTANGVIARQDDALNVIGALSSIFRGMMYWSAGGVLLSADMPKNTSPLLVNQANVVGGAFERPGLRHRDRVTSVKVAWNDPEDGFRQTIEVVEDAAAIRRFGLRQAQLAAFMCSSKGQARRVGRWVLASQILQPIIFQGGRDLAELRPGDVVKISDPDQAGERFGGRVARQLEGDDVKKGFYADKLSLTNPTHVSLRMPSGVVDRRSVLDINGSLNRIRVEPDFSENPDPGAMWIGESSAAEPEMARVLSVEEREGGVFQFECLSYFPSLFKEVDATGIFDPPRTSVIPSGPLPTPQDVNLTESLVASGPTVSGIATVEWRQTPDPRVRGIEAEVARPGDSYKGLPRVSGPPMVITNVSSGDYRVRLRYIDGFGRGGEWFEITRRLYGLSARPPAVANLRLARVGGLAVLSWDPVEVLDVKIGGTIIIRHSASSTGVHSATRAIDPVPGAAIQALVPALSGTYYVFVRDSGGRSGPVVSIAADAATVLSYSMVGQIRADPAWSGNHVNTVAVEGDLRLVQDAGGMVAKKGTYTMAAGLDFGEVRTFRLVADVQSNIVNTNDSLLARPGPMIAFENMIGSVLDEADALVQIRISNEDPANETDLYALEDIYAVPDIYYGDGMAVWSPWQELSAGEFKGRAVEARITLTSNDPAYRMDVEAFKIEASEIMSSGASA